LLGTDGIILLILLITVRFVGIRLVGSRVSATSKVLRGTLLILINDTLVLGSTSRIVESLGQEDKSLFFEGHDLLFFSKRLLSFFSLNSLLTLLV